MHVATHHIVWTSKRTNVTQNIFGIMMTLRVFETFFWFTTFALSQVLKFSSSQPSSTAKDLLSHHKPHNQRCTLCSFEIREHYAFLTWVGLLWLRRHSAVHHSPILWRRLSLTVVEIRSKVVVDRRCSHERLLTFIVILRLTIVIVIVVVFDVRWFCSVCEKKVWVHKIQPQETKACKNRGKKSECEFEYGKMRNVKCLLTSYLMRKPSF